MLSDTTDRGLGSGFSLCFPNILHQSMILRECGLTCRTWLIIQYPVPKAGMSGTHLTSGMGWDAWYNAVYWSRLRLDLRLTVLAGHSVRSTSCFRFPTSDQRMIKNKRTSRVYHSRRNGNRIQILDIQHQSGKSRADHRTGDCPQIIHGVQLEPNPTGTMPERSVQSASG